MQNMFKNVHSKRFILTYLGLVTLLLLFFLTLSQEQPSDSVPGQPHSMLTLFEPALEIPQLLAYDADNGVFTNDTLIGKWTFFYFTSTDCIDCTAMLKVLENLKAGLANRAIQVVLVTNDQPLNDLTPFSKTIPQNIRMVALPENDDANRDPTLSFFVRSRAYEHQDLDHAIFLVNPKGMLTARFQAPFTSILIRQSFIEIRKEYANKS